MWVKEMEPDVWARTRHICVAKDYVTVRLIGVLVTDPSDASSTDAYDLTTHAWSPRMLAAAEIDLELPPEILPSTTVAGGLTVNAAEHTGLPVGTPVVVGGGDGPMASVGAGAITPADGAYVCLGSSAWVAFSAKQPLIDPLMRSFTFEHIAPGYYSPTATMQAGGASLHCLTDLLEPGVRADRFSRLLAGTSTEPAARGGLFFLPYLLGERSPHWNPAAAGSFVGLGRHHGRGDMVRAVLEGVAFNLRTCLTAFAENGVPITQLDVIGGGATSNAWLGILANVWGIPVRRRSIIEEANSLGAAVTALVGVGLADFSLARTLSTVPTGASPNRCCRPVYSRASPPTPRCCGAPASLTGRLPHWWAGPPPRAQARCLFRRGTPILPRWRRAAVPSTSSGRTRW